MVVTWWIVAFLHSVSFRQFAHCSGSSCSEKELSVERTENCAVPSLKCLALIPKLITCESVY